MLLKSQIKILELKNIAQQEEIEQLKGESIKLEKDCKKLITEMLIETHNTIHLNLELASENTKLKEALKLI